MPGFAAAPQFTTADFERRRQERETTNERVVSGIMVGVLAVLLGAETVWTDLVARAYGDFGIDFTIPAQIRWATAATLAGHALLLVFLAVWPAYFAARKYLIVAMRSLLCGGVCWGEWFHLHPRFGLLVPVAFFMLVIVMAGLSYSRGAVVLAGILAIVIYAAVTLLGPEWPLSLRAAGLAAQAFIAVTLVTFRIVSSMRAMAGEAVVNERMSRFFSPEIAARIATEPELAVRAAECRVTVLFSDISGFTAMASRMPPQEVVDLLNAYFPEMVEIVLRHGGTLEKFVGDALLAVWGAPVGRPDDAERAVTAAVEMQAALERFNAPRVAAGATPIRVHVGIASGQAAAGYIGTDRYIQYAVIGDTTNVASRICSAAGPGEILVGAETRALMPADAFALDEVPPIVAKGKDRPLEVFRVRSRA